MSILTNYLYNGQIETYWLQESKKLKKDLKVLDPDKNEIDIIPSENKIYFFYNYFTEEKVSIVANNLIFYEKRDLRKYVITSIEYQSFTEVNLPNIGYDIINDRKTLLANLTINGSSNIYKTENSLLVWNKKELIVIFGVLQVRKGIIIVG